MNNNSKEYSHINTDLVYEVMSTPTYSRYEYRLSTYIVLWARRNKINYELDDYGNIYLTKGVLNEDEYYPCVTSHLDTVQNDQKAWAQVGLNLEVKTRTNKEGQTELYVDDMGIGADCKSGVVISLSLFKYFDKLKACFFLEEEIGMQGSSKLNTEWFNDVGYVIGWDSPDLNRAAWSCSGAKLFDKKFFTENIQSICADNGVTTFNAEPYTDVKCIREKTNIICMNFGNGGYDAHSSTEYCVIEDMNSACKMGVDLINHLGKKQYLLEHTSNNYGKYVVNENNVKIWKRDEDSVFFENLKNGGKTKIVHKEEKKESKITIQYVSTVYENYIKDVKAAIKKKCKDLKLSFEEFKECFDVEVKF